MAKTPKSFSRKGLHRLECSGITCDGFAYLTIAQLERNLERHGRLMVCACGEEMRPERVDLVFALGMDELVEREIRQRTHNSESSQQRSLGRSEVERRRGSGTLNDMYVKTLDDIRAEEREAAKARRRRGLVRGQAMAEPIPF